MKMMTCREAAQQWKVSIRRVQDACKKGKLPGAQRFGGTWMIPVHATRPTDGRTVKGKKEQADLLRANLPMPRKTPFLHMTDLYSTPGKAQQSVEALADNPEAQTLLAAEIAYSQGDIYRVYESASYLLEKHSGFYAILSAGMLLGLCAIWSGDLTMWRKAKIHITQAHAKTDTDRDIMLLCIAALDSILYDVSSFPEWFKIGCFDPLHRDSLPAAKVYYAKYLYAASYALATKQLQMDGVHGLGLMAIVPFTIEPMISQAAAESTLIAEIYLRMTCATVYHNSGNSQQAVRHLDRAIQLALPDGLLGILAEYRRVLDSLLEQRILRVSPAAWDTVKKLSAIYNAGWTKLSGTVRGRSLATTLTTKEREVAKLAAFGLKNGEIASRLHMSVSGVKQTVSAVSSKTGVKREEFAAIL